MTSCLSPPRWRMTQHALDRMAERGIARHQVVEAVEDPHVTRDGLNDDVRIAIRDDLWVAYNHLTGDVVTVARRDEDQHLEQHMSGWINLDAKQAEKLLTDWGFEIHSAKDKSNLWTHPIDAQKRLIPFSIPGRGAKANGKGSFRTAAQVVNVSVHEFIKGPPADWAEKMALLNKIEQTHRLIDAPDPLGINKKVVEQATAQIAAETDRLTRAPATPAEEKPMPTATEEKVLAALLEATEPVGPKHIARQVGMRDATVREALRSMEKAGDVFRVGLAPAARAGGGGAPAHLWWYAATYEPDPAPEPATAPEPDPLPTPQETPVHAVAAPESVIDLTGTAEVAKEKLFTATGTPWPTGGILIQDEDGVFYVARKLVEEGR